jgi:hypothetical protein
MNLPCAGCVRGAFSVFDGRDRGFCVHFGFGRSLKQRVGFDWAAFASLASGDENEASLAPPCSAAETCCNVSRSPSAITSGGRNSLIRLARGRLCYNRCG